MKIDLIPSNVKKHINILPKNKDNKTLVENIKEFRGVYGDDYVDSIIWCQEDAKKVISHLGIDHHSTFSFFYLHAFELPEAFRSEELYGLSEIFEDFKDSFWEGRYTEINSRYIQLSSIEGEFSYFYDKKTDAVYGVDWIDMNSFIKGELPSLFPTFFIFLEWYFSEIE